MGAFIDSFPSRRAERHRERASTEDAIVAALRRITALDVASKSQLPSKSSLCQLQVRRGPVGRGSGPEGVCPQQGMQGVVPGMQHRRRGLWGPGALKVLGGACSSCLSHRSGHINTNALVDGKMLSKNSQYVATQY